MLRLLLAVFLLPLFCGQVFAAQLKATLLLEHGQPSAWTDMLRAGLKKGGGDFNIAVDVVVAPPGADQAEAFRQAARTSDLVLVASDNFHEILRDNAANFRRVMFGSIDAGIRAPNIMSVTFADERAAFLAGAAAAMQSHGRKKGASVVGWLSGEDTPAMRSLFNGFSEGAKLADPAGRVIQALNGSFTDPEGAARKAEWLADSGADVIALAAGAGNPAAAAAAAKRGASIICLDQLAPGARVLGAITKAADKAVYEIMASAQSGAFRGKEIVVYDPANGGTDFVLAGGAGSPDIARRVSELRRELERESIRVPSLRQRTLCDCLD